MFAVAGRILNICVCVCVYVCAWDGNTHQQWWWWCSGPLSLTYFISAAQRPPLPGLLPPHSSSFSDLWPHNDIMLTSGPPPPPLHLIFLCSSLIQLSGDPPLPQLSVCSTVWACACCMFCTIIVCVCAHVCVYNQSLQDFRFLRGCCSPEHLISQQLFFQKKNPKRFCPFSCN